MFDAAMDLVLDAQVRKHDVTPMEGQVVRLSKVAAIGVEVRVPRPVVTIQEDLEISFELVVEDDARDARARAFELVGFLTEGVVDA